MTTQDELKQQAAAQAAEMVQPGSILGVGTGSTVAFFIDALAARNQKTPLNLAAIVTTSSRSQRQLEDNGFHVSELAEIDQADLTIDGADRVDPQLDGIKGGGGALTLEKNVAINSKHNVWIVDESKVVDRLGGFPLPVEVLPVSCEQLLKKFTRDGLAPQFRLNEDGSRYVTHYGNYILDLMVSPLPIPAGLANYLDGTVGVVEHGLFLNMTDEVLIAKKDGTIAHWVRK
ncbi:ribose-5-phosphate isomerase RpiA [Lacticaseibacillus mingshuiensis]|uniref:Ribose-5-phosphate isomerase A n=2 Tax=Lacticaseibacillus mingshuiensis TaxID=2799574 RepID=A0ABW4CKY8_9LACO|nr:ribose-5-phosphate isomerase RpiA [Lacticaseibacillus mingshuiensis]